MVWGILGAPDRPHKIRNQESAWKSPHFSRGSANNCGRSGGPDE